MRQTHKGKIIHALKGSSYLRAQVAALWVSGGHQTTFIFVFTSKLFRLICNQNEKKETKLWENIKQSNSVTFKSTGLSYLHCIECCLFSWILLNGAWHFHYSRKLNLLIFLQAWYVCYFREVRRTEQLFQHLHTGKGLWIYLLKRKSELKP